MNIYLFSTVKYYLLILGKKIGKIIVRNNSKVHVMINFGILSKLKSTTFFFFPPARIELLEKVSRITARGVSQLFSVYHEH